MSMSVPGNSCKPCVAVPVAGCIVSVTGTCAFYTGLRLAAPNINTGDNLNIVINKLTAYVGSGTGVSSFNTRTGAVVPVTGDYTAAQVTNAVDTTQTYANPTWITSLAFSKITGVPAFLTAANDGLSLSSTTVKLGQTVGQGGNPAALTEAREIPTAGFPLCVSGTGNLVVGSTTDNGSKLQVNGVLYINSIPSSSLNIDGTGNKFIQVGGTLGINSAIFGRFGFDTIIGSSGTSLNLQLQGARIYTANRFAIGDISTDDNSSQLQVYGRQSLGTNAFNNTSFYDTWNTTASPTLLFANVTNTASGANSLLLDLQSNSVSQFSVGATGYISTADPTSGVGKWKLGKVITAASSLDTTRYVQVNIDGVVVKLAVIS